jgi:hypothetical protein
MRENVVRRNTITDIRNSGRSSFATVPRGIDFGSSGGTSKTRCGNIIEDNVILRVQGNEAIYAKGADADVDCEPLTVRNNYTDGNIRVAGSSSTSRLPSVSGNVAAKVYR